MVNTNIRDFSLYELLYRNAMFSKNEDINFDINISDDTSKKVMNIIADLQSLESKEMNELKFSDVVYEIFPKVDATGVLRFNTEPIFANNNAIGNVNDYIDRFRNFNINNLPLIEVAKLLGIRVEKSNQIDKLGTYRPTENRIILGTDYVPTFIHELAHAVDFHLSETTYEKHYSELVAELSTIILCKIYSIPIILSYSMYYLDSYTSSDINSKQLLNRVSEIVESIKKLKEYIQSKNID